MKKFVEKDVAESPLYHDTWKLLKKYRDVVWSLEISVQHVRAKFEIEYGTSIEEFLEMCIRDRPSTGLPDSIRALTAGRYFSQAAGSPGPSERT